MINEPFSLSPEENLRAENEIKTLNLELNYGMQHACFNDDAPPELISQWLDNVTRYEEQYANAEKISIHAFIGNPVIRPLESLEENDLEPEITRLMDLLEQQLVMTDRPEHLSPRAYYHFLSGELMQHLMVNCAVPGMIHFFPYDEFHRDGPEYIAAHASDFIQDLLNFDGPYEGIWLSENLRDEYHVISKTEVLTKIKAFRASWKEIELGSFAPVTLKSTSTGMYFVFHGEWFGTPVAGNKEREHHEGLGVIQMGFEAGDWLIQGVMMPGFKF